jgi:hypothetical protein
VEEELEDADELLARVRFATIDLCAASAAGLPNHLGLPDDMPVPWLLAFRRGKRIRLDASSTGGVWGCKAGALIGADICKAPGAFALLCEHLLATSM